MARTKSDILVTVASIRSDYRNGFITEDEQLKALRPLQIELLEVKRYEKFNERMHQAITC